MFIGRDNEMKLLENLFNEKRFNFVTIYGRRRVGKTKILQEFAEKHNVLFFSAQEQSTSMNLKTFAISISKYFEEEFVPTFQDWYDAIMYLNQKIQKINKKFVLIIDEFPFIAKESPEIKSLLQHTIDHSWQNINMMLILCGSSVSFMINEVMGYTSPLYERTTTQLEIKPLDYLYTKQFFPNMSNVDRLISYGILGGIPLYLLSFSDTLSIEENIANTILSPQKFMLNEPMNLLRAELREPLFYNSILYAIASGSSKLNEIATKIHAEDGNKCSKYLSVLREIRLIDKQTPYGETHNSRKSIYALSDNYYRFWYKFIFEQISNIEFKGRDNFANEIMQWMPDFMGMAFENICVQYLYRLAQKNKLPFIPNGIGKWWGNNPTTKKQDDIDIMGIKGNKGIFCECKFRNEKFDLPELNDLINASNIFSKIDEKYYYIFVKSGYTDSVIKESKKYNIKLLTIDDLFDI